MTRDNYVAGWKILAFIVVAVALLGTFSVGGCAGLKSFNRAQRRADANNKVAVTHILVRNAQQQAQITRALNAQVKAKAQQRYFESVGIRRAQDEISKTLTPLYIQHEAIQAEEAIARSGRNDTVVYVPSGAQGVPLVNNVGGTKPGAQP